MDGASLRLYYEYINYFIKKKYDVLYIYFSKKKINDSVWSKKKPQNLKIIQLNYDDHFLPNKFTLINKLNEMKNVATFINSFKADAVVAFDIISISQIIECNCKNKIGWLGDLRFRTNYYHFYYSVRENILNVRHILYNLSQNYLLKKKYKFYLSKIDKVIVSSSSSVNNLCKIGIKSKFLPYPWPKNLKDHKKDIIEANYLFYGNLSGLGSRSALNILFYEIYPKLKKKFLKTPFKIFICGKNFDKSLLSKINFSNFPEIKYLGFVKDLDSILKNCIAVIFPGNVPVGNRCRLVSCMASRVLIIAHKSCSKGNPLLVNKSTALLVDNSSDFVNMMHYVFKNNSFCDAIKDNAKIAYNENYKPKVASRLLERLIYEKYS